MSNEQDNAVTKAPVAKKRVKKPPTRASALRSDFESVLAICEVFEKLPEDMRRLVLSRINPPK